MTLRSPSLLVSAAAATLLGSSPGASSLTPARLPPVPPDIASNDGGGDEDAGSGGSAQGAFIDGAGPDRAKTCRTCPHVCSFRHPICIHGTTRTAAALALDALRAAERAWDALTSTLGVPAPDGGLDGVWQVELVDNVEGGGSALLAARDPLARFDRAASFAVVDRATPAGCALDFALARAVARASLWRSAPATDEGSARAEVEALARLVTPCAPGEEDRRAFQAHPERTLVESRVDPRVDPDSAAFDRGASLFFGWLDATFGSEPGGLLAGLWALSPTRTPAGAARWAGAPTGFDVMRVSLASALWQGSRLDDVFVKFAVERATADPPAHLAWHVPWPANARRLASPEPVGPTGASYVMVDLDGAPPTSRLRLEAEWEDYGRMRWVALKLDGMGRTTATLPIGSLDRATRASMTVDSLDGVSHVLVVGVNVGSTEHPFDPDQAEWEPHGWLLTLEGE